MNIVVMAKNYSTFSGLRSQSEALRVRDAWHRMFRSFLSGIFALALLCIQFPLCIVSPFRCSSINRIID
jgi:hypothetical protein